MPAPDHRVTGAPCWIDLFTSDPDKAEAFYGGLFGWTATAAGEEYGGYITFSLGAAGVAGAMKNDGSQGTPDGWSVYLQTDDIKSLADHARENGATVFVEPMEIPKVGHMVVMADPTGAAIGAWQALNHVGFDVIGEPGTPSWFELHTRDHAAAVAFYRDVFGWDVRMVADTPEFRYATLLADENARAGIMDASSYLPEGGAHWRVYFAVDDVDATLAKAQELGGTVTSPAEDTPYGRLAVLNDPTGAMFALQGPNIAG